MSRLFLPILTGLCLAGAVEVQAQDITPPGYKLPPLGTVTPATPAKQLFGRRQTPAPGRLNSIGFYAKGCLDNARALPLTGSTWQVMRLSRNRYWGNPVLVSFLKRFAAKVPQVAGVAGILVGDMSQPRGGPMITGHTSHQIGLDVDIWYMPMPNRLLSENERETIMATKMVRRDRLDVSPAWTKNNMAVVEAAARDPHVERVFTNAAIKKAICRDARGDRSWLAKVRPIYGHDFHFHVRLSCPSNSPACKPQKPPTGDEGCGSDLDYWFSDQVLHPKLNPNPPPPHQMLMSELPPECRQVLAAP